MRASTRIRTRWRNEFGCGTPATPQGPVCPTVVSPKCSTWPTPAEGVAGLATVSRGPDADDPRGCGRDDRVVVGQYGDAHRGRPHAANADPVVDPDEAAVDGLGAAAEATLG